MSKKRFAQKMTNFQSNFIGLMQGYYYYYYLFSWFLSNKIKK